MGGLVQSEWVSGLSSRSGLTPGLPPTFMNPNGTRALAPKQANLNNARGGIDLLQGPGATRQNHHPTYDR